MGQEQPGLSNADYAIWMTEIAAEDCGLVEELYIHYINDDEQTLTNNNEICQFMTSVTESLIATIDKVVFSGHDGDDEPWSAIDERLTINLERTENNGVVPVKIKRPRGK